MNILFFPLPDGKTYLREKVIDCGPAVDLEKTPGCVKIPIDETHAEKPFPECCPLYDCEEGTKIVYVRGPAPVRGPQGNKEQPRTRN